MAFRTNVNKTSNLINNGHSGRLIKQTTPAVSPKTSDIRHFDFNLTCITVHRPRPRQPWRVRRGSDPVTTVFAYIKLMLNLESKTTNQI